MGRGVFDDATPNTSIAHESRVALLRDRPQLLSVRRDRRTICAQQRIVQNEANCAQVAKCTGALRVCALWRAARTDPKIRGMQNFFDATFNAPRSVCECAKRSQPGGSTTRNLRLILRRNLNLQ